jgi:hypothetical protein
MLMTPFGNGAPLFEAQYVPQIFWNSMSPDDMEAWLKSRLPAEMHPTIAKEGLVLRPPLEAAQRYRDLCHTMSVTLASR